jgi:DNA polymerase-1
MEQPSLFQEFSEASSPIEKKIAAAPFNFLSFDVEATGRDPMAAQIVGIALCKEKGTAYYVPIGHLNSLNIPDALLILRDVLENENIAKIGHNLKFDILMLRQEGINTTGRLYDTMLASYLLNPNKQGHSLEDVGIEFLNHKKKPFKEVLGKHETFAEVPINEAVQYAAEDAELAMELKEILFERLNTEGLEKLYFDIEMPLIYVLADMQYNGIKIDSNLLNDLSKELERELDILKSKIFNLAGKSFNINSSQQLGRILFEDLGLKAGKKTKTGYSTNVEVLQQLAVFHELPAEVLNYRTLYKLKTTYIDTLPNLINAKTGRIHTSFNQTVTATGRLSSSDPNLQNIPIRGELGTKIRQAFAAEEGATLISADYSQIELRILAHMSRDNGLIDAFIKGVDIHTRTAAEIFNVPADSVAPDLRRAAKTVNFGIIYGISPFGLSESLNITPKDAADLIESYFTRYPSVRDFIDSILREARKTGFVSTLLGRKRGIADINSSNTNIRQQAERMAINTPIQGTAADLIKIAMIRIFNRLVKEGFKTKMTLQIHDELLFEAPFREVDDVIRFIKHEMETALELSVPLIVDIRTGKNWAEAK